jgi:hypothetical protein
MSYVDKFHGVFTVGGPVFGQVRKQASGYSRRSRRIAGEITSPAHDDGPTLRRTKGASTSLTVFRRYYLRSAVLGGARIRAAHAAVRSESG